VLAKSRLGAETARHPVWYQRGCSCPCPCAATSGEKPSYRGLLDQRLLFVVPTRRVDHSWSCVGSSVVYGRESFTCADSRVTSASASSSTGRNANNAPHALSVRPYAILQAEDGRRVHCRSAHSGKTNVFSHSLAWHGRVLQKHCILWDAN
jgi:hypothetical protein